jgi:hypothetical protein
MQIELNEEQIKFLQYCDRFKDKLMPIFLSGILEIRNGKGVINFDKDNHITTIQKHTLDYQRKKNECLPLTGFPNII